MMRRCAQRNMHTWLLDRSQLSAYIQGMQYGGDSGNVCVQPFGQQLWAAAEFKA